jgi:hypothetical protein
MPDTGDQPDSTPRRSDVAERTAAPGAADERTEEEEEFRPIGTLFLLLIYIFIFATAWGLVYFADMLARR